MATKSYTFTTANGKKFKVNASSDSEARKKAEKLAKNEYGSTLAGTTTAKTTAPAKETKDTKQKTTDSGRSTSSGSSKVSAPNVTRNLEPGSQGDDVKQLQSWLVSMGYSIPGGATGYYGSQTKAAVAKWQADNGVAAGADAGYFGPKSRQAATGRTAAPTPSQPTSPAAPKGKYDDMIANNPALADALGDADSRAKFDAMPEDLQGYLLENANALSKAIEAGSVVNPDIEINPSQVRKFLKQAEKEIDPYYQEKLGLLRDGIETSLGRLSEDFTKTVERGQETFRQNVQDQSQAEAEAGMAYSSGRQKRLDRTVQVENDALADLATGASRSARDMGVQFEETAGSDAARKLNIPSINLVTANAKGSYSPTGSRSLFDPLGSVELGSVGRERKSAVEARKSELERNYRSGRVLDLSNLSD